MKEKLYYRPLPDKCSELIQFAGVMLYVIEPKIVVIHFTKDITLDIDLLKRINRTCSELAKGEVVPHMLIACPGTTVTKEAREWGVSKAANKYTLVTGIVCNSLAHKILGNFIIKVQKPPVPTKMFADVETAKEWLIASMN